MAGQHVTPAGQSTLAETVDSELISVADGKKKQTTRNVLFVAFFG